MTGAPVDLSRPRSIHVVGAGGAGMSAIATVLTAMGHRVTGSDLRRSTVAERLTAGGIPVAIGHDAGNIGDATVVTVSSAVSDANPEVEEARRRGIPVLSRAEILAAIAGRRRCIAVAGTHGKTTTSSMLALILVEAGLDPSFLIGGDVNEIGTNAVWGEGPWLVVEADESDGTFLALPTEIAVVTNIEADHLDHFGSFEELRRAFATFLDRAGFRRVASGDDPVAAELATSTGAETVGTGPGCTYRIADVTTGRSAVGFRLTGPRGVPDGRIELPIPGVHNAANAAVATVAAMAAGAPFDAAVRALARFAGVARRFEFRGEANGVTFVDDYAHLPTEVQATLAAARTGAWSRIVAVFQPHRYSRVSALWEEFATAFDDADVVVVTDVYGAGEAPIPGVSGRLVADAIRRARPGLDVHYAERRSELRHEVASLLAPGDLCCTLGAGDLTSLPDELRAEPSW